MIANVGHLSILSILRWKFPLLHQTWHFCVSNMAFYHEYLIVFGFIIRPIGSKRDILISTTTLRKIHIFVT